MPPKNGNANNLIVSIRISYLEQRDKSRGRRVSKLQKQLRPTKAGRHEVKCKAPAGRRRYESRYSTQRLKSREALVPPKPKEFESA
jgi:hypothetical protein